MQASSSATCMLSNGPPMPMGVCGEQDADANSHTLLGKRRAKTANKCRADVDSRATACPRTPKAHGLHEHARAPPHRPHERLHDAAPPRPCRALARTRAVAAHLFLPSALEALG